MAASILGWSRDGDVITYWRIQQDGVAFQLESRIATEVEWRFAGRSSLVALIDVGRGVEVHWNGITSE